MGFYDKKIFSISRGAFGLDLSDLSVKVVQMKENNGDKKVVSFGSADISQGSIIDGEIIKQENVVMAIKKAIKGAGPNKIKTRKVICSLPETKAFLRIINLPEMREDEMQEAIKWEIEANIPMSADQVYYDWQIIDKNLIKEKGKESILVVAFSKKVIGQFLETLELSGLEVVGMEIESIAQARSLLQENDERTSLVVDLGDRRTSLLVIIANIPCFTSSIPVSGSGMTDAISKMLNSSFDEAEKTKLAYGIGSISQQDAIFRSVKPILDGLATEIERTIDFYLSNLNYSLSVDRIIMCGGGSNMQGILPYLSKRLNREIELGNPWINFLSLKKIPIIDRRKSVQYSTAIGLAIKGLYL
ncbi:MAG: type IV pilus assembly protein PilM [Patescibacteria group bacterium]